jgi:antitoxin component YwqK of YwqJK toxin-antitoxin module
MIRNINIIFLTILICGCLTKEKRKTIKTFPSGKTEKEVIYQNHKDTLNYTEVTYFENGKVKSSIDFHDGRFNGKIVEYYQSGIKKFEGTTEMSSFIGIKYNYDENGKLSEIDSLFGKCLATDCCCDGVMTRFFANGQIKERFTHKSEGITGVYISYYENGRIKSYRHYIDGKVDGLVKNWSERGKLADETMYHLGLKEGIAIEYNDEYKVIGQYSNDKEEGEWKFIDTLGNVTQIHTYKNGISK